MKVLVVNAGSSSIKYQVMDMTDESVLAAATCLWALSLLPAQMLNQHHPSNGWFALRL